MKSDDMVSSRGSIQPWKYNYNLRAWILFSYFSFDHNCHVYIGMYLFFNEITD